MTATILLVDDERALLDGWARALRAAGHRPLCALTYREAMRALDEGVVDVVIADQVLNGRSGIDLLERVQSAYPQVVRVLVSGGDVDADEVIRRAAPWRYVRKTDLAPTDRLVALVGDAIAELERLRAPAVHRPAWEEQRDHDRVTTLTEDAAKGRPITVGLLVAIVLSAAAIVGTAWGIDARSEGKVDRAISVHRREGLTTAHPAAAQQLRELRAEIKGALQQVSAAIVDAAKRQQKAAEELRADVRRMLARKRGRR